MNELGRLHTSSGQEDVVGEEEEGAHVGREVGKLRREHPMSLQRTLSFHILRYVRRQESIRSTQKEGKPSQVIGTGRGRKVHVGDREDTGTMVL